jgi:hypothetical protein
MLRSLPFFLVLLFALAAPAAAQNCGNTSVGSTPLNDLSGGSYQGFPGGLYPNGNTRPFQHETGGLAQMAEVVPRGATGGADPNGVIGLLSIGMSNTTQEFSRFMQLANADPQKNPKVVLVDGAVGGQAAEDIASPFAPYWQIVQQRIAAAGLTNEQVQVVWLKEANRGPTDPFPQHAQGLESQLAIIVGLIRTLFPNARLCYLSSRIYGGYATSTLNPEPYAYESAFSVRWLIERQIGGDFDLRYESGGHFPPAAPWLSWGPHTWADGLTPRSDGLIWECADFAADGTHPSASGRTKVAQMLLDFFKTDSTTAPWFLGAAGPVLDQTDLVRGRPANFRVRGAAPGERVHYLYSLSGTGAGPCPGVLGGLCLDLLSPVVLMGDATANGIGTAVFSRTVPSGAPLVSLHTQAVMKRGAGGANSVKTNTVSAPILP